MTGHQLLCRFFAPPAALFAGALTLPLWLPRPKTRRAIVRRMGSPRLPRFDGITVWVHALSVGEVNSAASLVYALADRLDGERIVVTAATESGLATAGRLFAGRVAAVLPFPADFPHLRRKALRALNPALAVVVETDLWPNFLEETARRGVPVVLANARMSDRSFARYRRFRFLFRPLYRRLRRICAQSALDADRYVRLGVSRKIVKVTGNLKFDRPLPPVSAATAGDRTRWGPAGDAPVIVAGSTHEGEEAILATVLAHLHGLGVPARMLVAPRDPARGAAAAQCFRRAGFQPGRLSREDTAGGPVFIVDAVGLLEELYAVSSVSVVGGSFVAEGGHNPLEPAACAKPVIFGPDMRDFREAAERLTAAGGAWQVQDAGGLREGLWHLLRDPEAAAAMGARARRVLDENRGALSCHLETILSLLEYRDL